MPEDAELWMVMFPSLRHRHAGSFSRTPDSSQCYKRVSRRIRAARRASAMAGIAIGERAPVSYEYVYCDTPLDPSTTKAGAVGRVFSRQADESCRMIDFTRN